MLGYHKGINIMLTFILVAVVAVSSQIVLEREVPECTKENPCYELEHGVERPYAIIDKNRFYIGGTN